MAANVSQVVAEVKKKLAANDLATLFGSVLVWDDGLNTSTVKVGTATAEYVASKSRVPVWLITAETEAEVDALDKRLRKESFERLLVWQRPQGRTWLFPEKTSSGTRRSKTTESNLEAIAQRLAELRFEPGGPTPTVLDVKERLQRTFSVEKVTERFYKEFKDIHDRLGGRRADEKPNPLLRGLPDINASRWYASVLLNRLMFLYFLQRKGFLDNDMDYLQNRMRDVQKLYGKGKFYTFYTSFLRPLFEEAVGSPRWDSLSPELKKLVGRVPYLNGGVFAHHQLEKEHTIELDDDIFTDIFEIFRRYRWHLDESEHAEDQSLPQINPDILGHIFERYVNEGDEETGAFYTPSDVTRWMTTRTVGSTVLQRLSDLGVDLGAVIAKDPERYLPSEHFVGRVEADEWLGKYPKLGTKEAAEWSKPVPAGRGLPTETVWEVRDRLKYAAGMTKELGTGKFGTPAELFRFNLNNPVLISDAMRTLTPEKLQKYWDQLFSITVVDPTCGSGAFLLAALAFLEELALDALNRADEFAAAPKINAPTFVKEFTAKNLAQRRLSIRTNFIIRSLYGADLWGEAVEIARLRLYLAIVATTNEYDDLKPLPDLEFNLAEGNLLVGVNSKSELEQLIGPALWAQSELPVVHARLNEVSDALNAFTEAQRTNDHVLREEKKIIARQRAIALKEQLNIALHKAMAPEAQFATWLSSHEPLHYLAQFPTVMLNGGFDVVIGNPPYINRRKITTYTYAGIPGSDLPDIYAPCAMRAYDLASNNKIFSMVLPLSSAFNEKFSPLREYFSKRLGLFAQSSFGIRPEGLFAVAAQRITINSTMGSSRKEVLTTRMHRWAKEFRPALLQTLRYVPIGNANHLRMNRIDGLFMDDLIKALSVNASKLDFPDNGSHRLLAKGVVGYNFPVSLRELRSLTVGGKPAPTTAKMVVWKFQDKEIRDATYALLASRLGYIIYQSVGDGFNVSSWILKEYPLDWHSLEIKAELSAAAAGIAESMDAKPAAHVWAFYNGIWVESLDYSFVRAQTDLLLEKLFNMIGLSGRWDEWEAIYWRSMKVTGEGTHVVRDLLPPVETNRG